MHRFGTSPREAVELATAIHSAPELRLAGVMTHFASADDPDPAYSRMQAETFDIACNAISATGIDIPSEHLCNSAAALAYPEYHRDRVRVGIAMYGLRPDPELLPVPVPEPMRPIMTIHSRLARVLDIEPGDRVSYGGSWKAESATRIGLVPIGYADGYRRQGSNRAWMDVNGSRAPVRGRVCMDQTMIEVGDNARQGDPVTVIGNGATSSAPTIDELAVLYGSISHEVATSYAIQRLGHLYVRDGALVAVSDLWGYRELDEDAFAQSKVDTRPG